MNRKEEFRCDLNCPAHVSVTACCKHCGISKKQYKTESNKHLWSDNGFWMQGGCALSRDQMPQECKEFDCKNHSWVIIRKWLNGKWEDTEMYEVPVGHRPIGIGTVKEEDGVSM